MANISQPLRVLVFTDAHVDFDYQEGKSIHCDFTTCCRKDSPDAEKPEDRAGPFGHVGRCDLPKRTLDSFLEKVTEINPDIVLWLGDNPAHNTYNQKKDNHLEVFNYIANYLRDNYTGKVYTITGNHDGLPDGQFDLFGGRSQWILDGFAEGIKDWYSDEGVESMKHFGRFSELVPNTKLRIIGLNNFVMDFTNSFLLANATDAYGQLGWLEDELGEAEENDEKVIIIGHVAVQSKTAERTWGYRYSALVDRYSNTIIGQFYGHMHEDYFFLMKSFSNPNQVVGVTQVHPSLTTFSAMNPSFRVYEVDRDNYRLLDYKQYRLMVKEANKQRKAEWEVRYQFKKFYEVQSMAPSEFEKIVNKMRRDKEYMKKILKMHYAEGPKGGMPSDQLRIDYMLCRYSSGNFYEFSQCVNWKYPGWKEFGRFEVACRHIFPDWWIAFDSN